MEEIKNLIEVMARSWSRTISKGSYDFQDLLQEGWKLYYGKKWDSINHFSHSLKNTYHNLKKYSSLREIVSIEFYDIVVETKVEQEELFMLECSCFFEYLKGLGENDLLIICVSALNQKKEITLKQFSELLKIKPSTFTRKLNTLREKFKEFRKIA